MARTILLAWNKMVAWAAPAASCYQTPTRSRSKMILVTQATVIKIGGREESRIPGKTALMPLYIRVNRMPLIVT